MQTLAYEDLRRSGAYNLFVRHPVTLLLFLCVLSAAPAHACSCMKRLPPAREFEQTQVTFVGEVVAVRDRFHALKRLWAFTQELFGRDPYGDHDDYERRFGFDVTFRVERMWRGPGTRTVRILTARGGGDCGYEFERGKRYLVYATATRAGEWSTNICSRTREIEYAAEDLEFLNEQTPVALK